MQAPPASSWPFRYPLVPPIPEGTAEVRIDNLHEAFINRQTANTRLITTNPTYLIQVWMDAVGADAPLICTADRETLDAFAPEVLAKRGPFARANLQITFESAPPGPLGLLERAFRDADADERLSLCIEALNQWRGAPVLLASASVCMEVNDLDAAARDLDEALALAPDWAAAHFEAGKLWLRRDEMERAAESFGRTTSLMPSFASAWANLGATLGELDRPDEALAAFEQALAQDPLNPQALNNVGVARRELGRLDDSAAMFRQVIAQLPDRAFGHYNLGHTLFLQGRYQAALSAYSEGQRRDPDKNPVQATRLAMCRLAIGDAPGALADLRTAVSTLPQDYKRQLLADTQTIAMALLTHRPDLPGWADVSNWLGAELAKHA